MTVDTQITADELLRMPEDGWPYELVDGKLLPRPLPGIAAGAVAATIIASLWSHPSRRDLGSVLASCGFQLRQSPDTVRIPSVAFVRKERTVITSGFFSGPPDVAFEVVSPADSYMYVDAKRLDWLRAGVQAVVIVEPEAQRVVVDRSRRGERIHDVLAIEDVVPGWRLPLSELFGDA